MYWPLHSSGSSKCWWVTMVISIADALVGLNVRVTYHDDDL